MRRIIRMLTMLLLAAAHCCCWAQTQLNLSTTLLGSLPVPVSASTYFSRDGSLFIAVNSASIVAYHTLSGAVVWSLPVVGAVCPTERLLGVERSNGSFSSSGSERSSSSLGIDATPVYTQPDPSWSAEVALYTACGPRVAAIAYMGASTIVYDSSNTADNAVAVTTQYDSAAQRISVFVVFDVGMEIAALVPSNGAFNFSSSYTVLWRQPLTDWNLFGLVVDLEATTDPGRNISLVSVIVAGFDFTNMTGFEATTGRVLAYRSIPVLSTGYNPKLSRTVVGWSNGWSSSAAPSLNVLDLVTGEHWIYYTVFPIDFFAPTNNNSFILASVNQAVLFDAITRQPVWTYASSILYSFPSYDSANNIITLWGTQVSNVVMLLDASTGVVLATSTYPLSAPNCVPALGSHEFAGVAVANNALLALSCNATTGYAVRLVPRVAARRATVSVLPSALVPIVGLPTNVSYAPTLATRVVAGQPVVLVTVEGTVTFLYHFAVSTDVPPPPTTITSAPTPPPTTPNTPHPTAAPPITEVPPSSPPPPSSSSSSTSPPSTAPAGSSRDYLIGGVVGVCAAMIAAGFVLIVVRRQTNRPRRMSMSATSESVAINADLLIAVAADTE